MEKPRSIPQRVWAILKSWCEILLSHGADVNARDRGKLTPLHRAASYAQADVVELLLMHKADRHAKSWDGKTALDYATEKQG